MVLSVYAREVRSFVSNSTFLIAQFRSFQRRAEIVQKKNGDEGAKKEKGL